MTRLVVVGASLAGLRAVEAARRTGFEGEIVLVGREPALPYDRPPLSKRYLVGEAEVDFYKTEEEIRDGLGVDLRLGVAATGLRPGDHVLETDAGELAYDRLILATGASPRMLPGVPDLDGIVTLRNLEDSDDLRRRIRPGSHVIVLGAGFIGSEIASTARKLGAHATVVEGAPVPLVRAVGDVVGAALAELHPRAGTPLRLSTTISAFHGIDGRLASVELSTGETIPADVVVIGIGASPATSWLDGSGIVLDERDGGVRCDATLRTSLPDVWAAGDIVHWPNAVYGRTMRLENWTNASDQGMRAGANAADPDRALPFETVPYFWSDWYERRIQFVGIAAGEVEYVSGAPGDDRFVAVFIDDDRVVGAATLDEPRKIMKLRGLISRRAGRAAVLDLVQPQLVTKE
ncbi:pyridine nucleotide-disulfide oxidoreductase [Agromyces rhizosphaerae]|uniref:Pyridine nucleotide-disulfide oxidoreductase n=1 Tax=Agromyces rhizosphaerae TaxID=88374 RepID=A0A9W6CXS4_9MICO|nr:FAD-dependent oxidoreductase [Agromyces rhizosphaerae]GLI28587.1 pyridine nucleotide-disulfide oxidoreductase [Agromyces rhizosphaerae]